MQHLLFLASLMTLALTGIAVGPALAHDVPRSGAQALLVSNKGQPAAKGDKAKGDEAKGEEEGPDTEDLFGFTIGTDVLEKGHYEVSSEVESAFGKRFGRYRVHALKNTFTFAPFDGLSIELGATGNNFSIRNVPGLENRSFSGFGGVSAEIKWQLVKRGPSPFGLTLLAEPSFGFLDESTGERGRSQGLETRLLLDTALIPDKLFAGLNVIYEAEKFRPRGTRLFSSEGEELDVPLTPCVARPAKVNAAPAEGEGDNTDMANADESKDPCTAFARRKSAERSSNFGVSGALAFQAIPNLFLGAEVRYLRAYEGLTLQRFRGEAVFVGPTLYAKLSDNLSISAAYSAQVAGHAVGVPGRLDLDNFSRHQTKLKIKYEF